MSIITGDKKGEGYLITYVETEVTCPICTFVFDCSKQADKARYPIFKMKCPACKGKIEIGLPIMGGELWCREFDAPLSKNIERLQTVSPNKVNGQVPPERKPYDDNSDEPSDIFV